jgi:hypothetical protein
MPATTVAPSPAGDYAARIAFVVEQAQHQHP